MRARSIGITGRFIGVSGRHWSSFDVCSRQLNKKSYLDEFSIVKRKEKSKRKKDGKSGITRQKYLFQSNVSNPTRNSFDRYHRPKRKELCRVFTIRLLTRFIRRKNVQRLFSLNLHFTVQRSKYMSLLRARILQFWRIKF